MPGGITKNRLPPSPGFGGTTWRTIGACTREGASAAKWIFPLQPLAAPWRSDGGSAFILRPFPHALMSKNSPFRDQRGILARFSGNARKKSLVSGGGFRRRDADGGGRDDRAPEEVANNSGVTGQSRRELLTECARPR